LKLFPHGKILMCPPDYFDVTYSINTWMDVNDKPDRALAIQQWTTLHHTLIRLGAWVECIKPQTGLPDMVFTANGGLAYKGRCVLSRFTHKERKGEEEHFKKYFESVGYKVFDVGNSYFEGEGDAMLAGGKLFAGYGFRTDRKIYDKIVKFLELDKAVLCELVDERFYHIDTCFCPISDTQAFYYPKAFTEDSIKDMDKEIELFAIEEEDAEKFACNSVVLGKNIVMPVGCNKTQDLLKKLGYETFEVDVSEFLKAGGSAKCMTMYQL